MEVGRWWSDGVQNSVCFYVFNIGTNKGSWWVTKATERAIKQYAPLTPISVSQTAHPACQNGEFNSLYAIHTVGMEDGRWWSDGVHNSVCFMSSI